MTMPRYIAAQTLQQPKRIYETGAISTARIFWHTAAAIGIAHSALYVIANVFRLIAGTTDDVTGSAWLKVGVANTFLRIVLTSLWCAACIVCEWSLTRLGEEAESKAQCWRHYVLSVAMSVIAVGLAIQFAGDMYWVMVIPACAMGFPALGTYFAIKNRRLARPQYSNFPPMGYPAPYGMPMAVQSPVPIPQYQQPIPPPQPPQAPYLPR